jgi:hypothetical protein
MVLVSLDLRQLIEYSSRQFAPLMIEKPIVSQDETTAALIVGWRQANYARTPSPMLPVTAADKRLGECVRVVGPSFVELFVEELRLEP